jgi:hypothetical protein
MARLSKILATFQFNPGLEGRGLAHCPRKKKKR